MRKIVLNGCFGGFSLSREAYEFLGLEWDRYGYEFSHDRENPKLVECVETLGEKADGDCAELYIEEYDDYNYNVCISEYDGNESLCLSPKIHKEKLQNMNTDEIIEYLTSLGITIVE